MQAIILAAGMGKRLGALTRNNTKCMVHVNGITLIERLLNQLDSLNLNRIIIVVGYEGHKLKEFVKSLKVKKTILFVENPIYYKTNNIYSLYLAKDLLIEDDTILLESDLIFEDCILTKVINSEQKSIALVAKFESWMDGTVVTIDQNDNIKRFISINQFSFEEIPSYYKTVNVYKFSKEFSLTHYVPFLEAYCKALGNNEYYEQVLKVITLLDKPGIKVLRLNHEKWYEIDDIQDLDIAESLFAKDNEKLIKFQNRDGGYWRFPSMLNFCYLNNPYFPTSKLKAEIKTNFDRIISEYPSGLNVNNLLASKYFQIEQEHICIGNGAAELIKSLLNNLNGKLGICYPTFEEYPNRKKDNKIVKFVANNSDFKYNASDLINFFSQKDISSLLLINPDNPSGNFIPFHELLDLLKWTNEHRILLIIDESFVDFSDDFEKNSLLNNEILNSYSNLVVIKSISISFGVPGLRLGIVASCSKDIIPHIKKDISTWNINSFAEFYLQIIGKYEYEYKNSCKKFIHERSRFFEELSKISFLRIIPSQANYFLCEVKHPYTAKGLTQHLLCKHNVLIRDCSSKRGINGKEYVRIAIRDVKDNSRLLKIFNILDYQKQ